MNKVQSLSGILLRYVLFWYLVLVGSTAVILFWLEIRSIEASVDTELVQVELSFGKGFSHAVWNLDSNMIEVLSKGIMQVPVVSGMELTDTVGVVLAEEGTIPTQTPKRALLLGGARQHAVALREPGGDGKTAIGTLMIFTDSSVLYRRMRSGFWSMLANTLIVGSGLYLALYLALVRNLSRPLTRLTESISQ